MPASNQDLVKGNDFTGDPTVTASDLNQLVDAAEPADDKGLVVTTTDTGVNPEVPDAATTTKWQRYMWRRIGAASVTIYTWNPNASTDVAYLKWQAITSASIPDGSITETKIATGAVTNDKIVSMDYTKLISPPTQWYNIGTKTAGGDLDGDYPDPVIAASAITSTKIAALTINAGNISNADTGVAGSGITVGKLYPHTVAKYKLRTNAGATAVEWAQGTYFDELVTLGTAGQMLKVNAGATAIEWFTATGAAGGLVKSYTESNIAYPTAAATVTSAAHGLLGQPDIVRWSLLCKGNASGVAHGYAVGDEVELLVALTVNFGTNEQGRPVHVPFLPVAATTAKMAVESGNRKILSKTGTQTDITMTEVAQDFDIKCNLYRFL